MSQGVTNAEVKYLNKNKYVLEILAWLVYIATATELCNVHV